VTGADAVIRQILARGTPLAPLARPALVNGRAGALVARGGRTLAVVGFTSAGGRIVAIDVITDRRRLP
jgi:RNA polymerase sigma-70 factor (ECF subfamily)